MDAKHQSSGKRGRKKKKKHEELDKLIIESMEERIGEDGNPRKLCTICKKDFQSGKVRNQCLSSWNQLLELVGGERWRAVSTEEGRETRKSGGLSLPTTGGDNSGSESQSLTPLFVGKMASKGKPGQMTHNPHQRSHLSRSLEILPPSHFTNYLHPGYPLSPPR